MKTMNKTKIKTICAGVLATVILSSTSVFAATDISTTSKSVSTSVHDQYYDGTVYAASASLKGPYSYNGKSYMSLVITMSDNSNIGLSTDTLVGYNYNNNDIAVKALQILLNHYGYGLVVSGVFDTKTSDSLYDFQIKHSECGIANGICDEKTWTVLANNF